MKEIVVVKVGGSTLSDPTQMDRLAVDIKAIKDGGFEVIVVHGGGPAISSAIAKTGHQCHFVDGLRVTDETVLKIACEVLDGINHQIVESLIAKGLNAVSIDSQSSHILTAKRKVLNLKSGTKLDIGFVGEISEVDKDAVASLLDAGFVPVFVSTAFDASNQILNVNADNAAMAIAVAVSATKLIYITDVNGIYIDGDKVLPAVDLDQIGVLIESGIIRGGMIPKVRNCAAGIRSGIGSVIIASFANTGELASAALLPGSHGTVIKACVQADLLIA